MDYLAVKHSHMAIAMLSVILFYVRAFSRMGSGKLAKNKVIMIGSHSIDTLLLVSALTLIFMAKINPFEQYWLLEKIILVVIYIGIGAKSARQTKMSAKIAYVLVNTAVIFTIGYLAIAKSALLL
ncbi:transcriptional regulator [Pseudoalteromonas sp. BSi20652]|uniref:SirB2 family protein n=1 Tax=Pseudoalteromonas sp. BSi20652 TaxID=388384 RepID=UPI00023170BD|nr:SirB2 family protein [Pseudoalteromonas sp. BSi20652]GAA61596.1 transcriptional regulator [Pseudoalteromonas sp. BSi20652]